MAQKIYFDESGFTGNNLLNKTQTWFSYASIATSDDEAKAFTEYLIDKYNIQNEELKGTKLIKYNKGRNAISEIFSNFRGRIKVSLSDKKYALAAKFFEYIFEPNISDINSIFYEIDFHRFIANLLHVSLVASKEEAEEIFCNFEKIMRNNKEDFENLFTVPININNSSHLKLIIDFSLSQKSTIQKELEELPGDGVGKWILDLTDSALFALLSSWGQEYEQITAVCDNSKPLQSNKEFYNKMINRKDKHFSSIGGDKQPITFNLSEPIILTDSKISHGIQLADAIAAASVYAVSVEDDRHSTEWKEYFSEIIHGSVFPEYKYVDLEKFEVQRNALLLQELHTRAITNKSLTDGISTYINTLSQYLHYNPLPIKV